MKYGKGVIGWSLGNLEHVSLDDEISISDF